MTGGFRELETSVVVVVVPNVAPAGDVGLSDVAVGHSQPFVVVVVVVVVVLVVLDVDCIVE